MNGRAITLKLSAAKKKQQQQKQQKSDSSVLIYDFAIHSKESKNHEISK